jgi:peroxiredoxin
MVATATPGLDLKMRATDFNLRSVDDKLYTLKNVQGKNGLLLIFMCNHCPYVQAIINQLVDDVKKLNTLGIGVVGINANDTTSYPEDSFENMKLFAKEHKMSFPYLLDETQEIAKAYGAVCTPDFFGFNSDLMLRYRGRFDNRGRSDNPEISNHELLKAMTEIASTGKFSAPQYPSIGCSIKWK